MILHLVDYISDVNVEWYCHNEWKQEILISRPIILMGIESDKWYSLTSKHYLVFIMKTFCN